jgi:tetratricopeptide (TPR) repeat protein
VVDRAFRFLVVVALALVVAPVTVVAQKDQFFDPLLPLYQALAGVYGDEGPRLTALVESMSAARTRWDTSIRAGETALRARLPGANLQTAMQAHALLASMYIERGRLTDALREFDEVTRLDPTRAAFHRFKALTYLALEKRTAAAEAFRAAWLADPADPQNAYQLLVHKPSGVPAVQAARARDALATLERSLARRERPKADSPFISLRPINDDAAGVMAFAPAAYARPISLLLIGQVDAGIVALRNAVSADPLVADAALRREPMTRGIAALKRGRVDQAIESMHAALALTPDSSEVHRILATAAIVNGDLAAGRQHLRDAVRLNPTNERAWLALARTLDDAGETVEAADVLRKAVTALPDSGELRWQLSMISGKRQRTDSADLELIAIADRLVLFVGTGELYGRVARLAQAHLDYDRGITLLEHRVALVPNSADAHAALGSAYVDQGREDEGYAELTVALWLEPDDVGTLTALGRLHLTQRRYPQAVEVLTRAVALQPANAQAVHALGDALVRAGNDRAGRQHLEEAEQLGARAVEAQRRARTVGMLSLQADVDAGKGDYDRAIETWRKAIALDRRSASAHVRLAEALIATRRFDEAVAELQGVASLDPGPDPHRRLADVYSALGRGDDSARERRTYTAQKLDELRQRAGESR